MSRIDESNDVNMSQEPKPQEPVILNRVIEEYPYENRVKELEAEILKLGSAYVSSLLTIGDLKTFVSKANAKGFDGFGGCRYCGRNKNFGHSVNCDLEEINKKISEYNLKISEASK